jgi:hypothetical protein
MMLACSNSVPDKMPGWMLNLLRIAPENNFSKFSLIMKRKGFVPFFFLSLDNLRDKF